MIANIARNAIDGRAQGPDPDFSKVSLLLHMDGANGSTTFTDSSSNALTVTASGAKISTSNAMAGFGQTGSFTGSAFLRIPQNAVLNFGTNDFTIECWIYPTSNAGARVIVSKWANGGGNEFNLYTNSSSIQFDIGTSIGNNLGNFSVNTWAFIAVTRFAGVLKGYKNGSQTFSVANSSNLAGTSDVLIGANDNGIRNYFAGDIDEVRIINGVARTITVPAGPFPNS